MASQVRSYVIENAEPWAKVGCQIDSIGSTNAEVQRRVSQQALPEGYSLRADFQHAGKGRLGRQWEASAGLNLTVSYLLNDPGLGPARLFTLSQNIALAVRAVVERCLDQSALTVSVKWPNDVYVGDKKIAGILIETAMNVHGISYIIAGVGLNVQECDFAHMPNATSLANELTIAPNVEEVWQLLTARVEQRHRALRQLLLVSNDVYDIAQAYHRHLYGLHRWHRFEKYPSGEVIIGRMEGVDAAGALRIQRQDEEEKFSLDEIHYLGELSAPR